MSDVKYTLDYAYKIMKRNKILPYTENILKLIGSYDEKLSVKKATSYFYKKENIPIMDFYVEELQLSGFVSIESVSAFFEIFDFEVRSDEMLLKANNILNHKIKGEVILLLNFFHTKTIFGELKYVMEDSFEYRAEKKVFKLHWYQVVMANLLEHQYYVWKRTKKGIRILCSIAPQAGKSFIFSSGFIPMIIGENPYTQNIVTSFSDGAAKKLLREANAKILDTKAYKDLYKTKFACHLTKKQKDSMGRSGKKIPKDNEYEKETLQGGIIVSKPMSALTGNPATGIMYLDDPYPSMESALSDTMRGKINLMIESNVESRIHPQTFFICVHTRWSQDDFIGKNIKLYEDLPEEELKEMPKLFNIVFRSLYDPTDDFDYDFRTERDQPIRRDLLSKIIIARQNVMLFNAIHQQRPDALEGVIFNKEWFNILTQNSEYRPNIENSRIVMSVDTSYKDTKGSDKCAIGVFAITSKKEFILLNLIYDRMSYLETVKRMKNLIRIHPDITEIIVEDRSNGDNVIRKMREDIRECHLNISVKAINPESSKKARAMQCQHVFEGGKFFVFDNKEGRMLIDQMCRFTGDGKHEKDDLVDITTQVINYYTGKREIDYDNLPTGVGSLYDKISQSKDITIENGGRTSTISQVADLVKKRSKSKFSKMGLL